MCEGVTDVWRFRKQAVAVFGIDYLPSQVRWISKLKKQARGNEIVVIFDDDPQAIVKAEKLVADFQFRGFNCYRIPVIGDPGGLTQKEADKILKEIMR